ncbi:unnamed protein product [Brassicogethes aeneus]|uniref:DUF4806 domain-containing protein n=1 Tax=Brassicogethes aeneus TaxID=1431903 RepID=A0A9P0FCA9_BRAAE|nr:unnamed protein product [Brassicogethes aeneus]
MIMASFIGVQFEEEGNIALISSNWLTPRKTETFWPPYKGRDRYTKALLKHCAPEPDWPFYKVKRVFFKCDNYEKANNKLKEAEFTSDVQSEQEIEQKSRRRRRKTPKRLYSTSEEDNSDKESVRKLQRPPLIEFNICTDTTDTEIPNISLTPARLSGSLTPARLSGSLTPAVSLSECDPLPPISSKEVLRSANSAASCSNNVRQLLSGNNKQVPISEELGGQILTAVFHVAEQNKEILSILKSQGSSGTPNQLPDDLPVQLPLITQEDVIEFEKYITNNINKILVVSYLSRLGGKDLVAKVNSILKRCIINKLACGYSFYGKRQNKHFFANLKLKTLFVEAVQSECTSTEKEVENAIKVWLKHAPQSNDSSKLIDNSLSLKSDCSYKNVGTENHSKNLNYNLSGVNILLAPTSCDSGFSDHLSTGFFVPSVTISNNSSSQFEKGVSLTDKLRSWALTTSATQSSVTILLHLLKDYYSELPLDCRTLLRTPTYMNEKILESGKYCHLGLSEGIARILRTCDKIDFNVLSVSFNIDGIPLFHSSAVQLWPILAQVKNVSSKPFAVGIFCDKTKPKPLNIFLENLIYELKHLLRDGIQFKNKTLKFEINSFICDAPARAFLKCVKSHGGSSSCERCIDPGSYIDGRVVLPCTSASLRTDQSFIEQLDEDHHIGTSPLVDLKMKW